jgi:hypothetical protein
MSKVRRCHKVNDALLRKLWPTKLTDAAIAEKMGHARWVLRRRAVKIGLPSSRRKLWDSQK